MDLSVSTDWSYQGLRAVVLENRHIRVVILPEAGAKIWQITHKPTDTDVLWNNPRMPPARLPMNSRYDDVWSGGWDELFPNDEAAPIDGEAYPDHGEVWTSPWHAEPFATRDEVGVHLKLVTPISAIRLEKTIRVRRDSSRIAFRHSLSNPGFAPFHFLWKLHPALAVTAQHRIDFPAMKVILEPGFPGTLGGAQPLFEWPYAELNGASIDLRCILLIRATVVFFLRNADAGGLVRADQHRHSPRVRPGLRQRCIPQLLAVRELRRLAKPQRRGARAVHRLSSEFRRHARGRQAPTLAPGEVWTRTSSSCCRKACRQSRGSIQTERSSAARAQPVPATEGWPPRWQGGRPRLGRARVFHAAPGRRRQR